MHDLAVRTPGRYFVFSSQARTIVAETETFTITRSKTSAA